MYRRLFLALTATLALVGFQPGWAETRQLKAAEIEHLLAGNTVNGIWAGSRYAQYFSADGVTVYLPAGGTADKGKWRANTETDEYESWWRSTGWTPYVIVRTEDGGHAYINGDALEPFTVTPGKQVDY